MGQLFTPVELEFKKKKEKSLAWSRTWRFVMFPSYWV
jgi:hypothetical protein